MQYKHGLTEKNGVAKIEDRDDEIVIRIKRKDLRVCSNGESSNNTTTDQGDGVVLA